MPHLDFKITSWRRINIPEGKVEEVKEYLKENGLESPFDLPEFVKGCYDATNDAESCIEALDLEDNAGFSTQEIYSDEGELLFKNGREE